MIRGLGVYLPDEILTNDDIASIMDTSDEWIRTRTGVGARRRAAADETTASLGHRAAEMAIENAGIGPEDLDMIIMGTMFPDYTYPGPGMVIQKKLKSTRTIPVIDIRVQCAGFIYALSMADMYIRSGHARYVLCVFAEKEFDHFKVDRQIGVIFGDGAGAAVIGPSVDGRGLLACDLQGDGNGVDDLIMTSDNMVGLGSDRAHWPEELGKAREYWEQRGIIPGHTKFPFWVGKEVFRNAVRRLTRSVRSVLDSAEIESETVDHFFLHQANARINGKLIELLRLPADKVPSNIERIGNLGAASIPVLMSEGEGDGTLKSGDLCLLSAFGAGYLWGTALMRY